MSVRSGIIAVLSLGPAYGSQVHGELEARTDRVGQINVGQIYSTLDRLENQGVVRSAGVTEDGLPLYGLTESGKDEVEAWVRTALTDASWSDLVGHVLMVASLPRSSIAELLTSYRRHFEGPIAHPDTVGSLGARASQLFAEAALAWLQSVGDATMRPDALARPLGRLRPRRGRRPSRAAV